MDQELTPHLLRNNLNDEDRDFYKVFPDNATLSHEKCQYIGTAGIDGVNYSQYICPNMYNKSDDAFLEINLPFANSHRDAAIIRSLDRNVLQDKLQHLNRPVHVILENWDGLRLIKPTYFQYVERSLPKDRSPVNYPTLITFWPGGVSYGQKIDVNTFSKEALIGLGKDNYHYFLICPDTRYTGEPMDRFLYKGQSISDNCEIWYWSASLKTIGNIDTGNRTQIQAKRYAGYLWTVPVDIVTAPFQLIIILLMGTFYH